MLHRLKIITNLYEALVTCHTYIEFLKCSLSIPNKFMSKNEKFLSKVDYIVKQDKELITVLNYSHLLEK